MGGVPWYQAAAEAAAAGEAPTEEDDQPQPERMIVKEKWTGAHDSVLSWQHAYDSNRQL